MVFEPGQAFLRYLRVGDVEILRGVYAAVRDRNWETVPPRVSGLHLREDDDAFLLLFEVDCIDSRQGIDFGWKGRIEGSIDGTVTFTFEGKANSSFLRNRIGFCVLYPASVAGRPCTVVHTGDTEELSAFPRHISPHQPFLDMNGLIHEAGDGLSCEVRFEGEVFEMEDQRNWSDDSFKAYCTPLSLPFPVEVPEGTTIRQAVTVKVTGVEGISWNLRAARAPEVRLRPTGKKVMLPYLGLERASREEPLTESELGRLKTLHLAHLRVDLELDELATGRLREVLTEADALGTRLEVALFLGDEAGRRLGEVADLLCSERIARVLLFHRGEKSTSGTWVRIAREVLPALDAPLVSGTNAYFAELNRERPTTSAVEMLDGICYSLNPQVHAFDDASLVETTLSQGAMVVSARNLAGLPVCVSPITLRPRFNPNATAPEVETTLGELPGRVDPRQATLFCAGWTLASLRSLAIAAAHSVTYFETTGWCGVMEFEAGSPLPELFPTEAGAVYPVYFLFKDVAACDWLEPLVSTDPLMVQGILVGRDSFRCALIANLSPEPLVAALRLPFGPSVHIAVLDAETAEAACRQPEEGRVVRNARADGENLELELAPHSYLRITPEGMS